jgi:hypothetical protein
MSGTHVGNTPRVYAVTDKRDLTGHDMTFKMDFDSHAREGGSPCRVPLVSIQTS